MRFPFNNSNEQQPSGDNNNNGLWEIIAPGDRVRRYLAQVAEEQAAEAKRREQEEREWKERSMEEKRMRSAFLEHTQAVHAEPELYGLWLYTYVSQGGTITHRYNYDMTKSQLSPGETRTRKALATIGPNGATFESVTEGYYSDRTPGLFWVPTTSNQSDKPPSMPCGHGSNSLSVLHLPDLAPIDTSYDVGHSKICTLQLDPRSPLGLKATTNVPYFVASYTDVTDLLVGIKGDFNPRRMRKQLRQLASNRPDRRLTTEDLPH